MALCPLLPAYRFLSSGVRRPATLFAGAGLLALLLAAGCGDPAPETKKYELPDIDNSPETSAEDSGFRFGDMGSQDASGDPDLFAPEDVSATEADAEADAPDGGPPAGITSCLGHCGILLTDTGNTCSCHASCKNTGDCCEDFEVACSCPSGDAACDDGDDCTTDTCKAGYCSQIPKPGKSCCHLDSECAGADKCTVPKCLEGSCSAQTTNCDDGLACTNDVCDPKTGECIHKLLIGQCAIDGACKKAGDNEPASNGCAICDPGKDPNGWSAKPGMCAIGGECVKSGAVSPDGTCAVCDPAKSSTAWSIKTGSCFIDAKCFQATTPNPANPSCEVCDPATSVSAWSGVTGKCAIEGKCYDSGATDPASPECSVCDPAKNKAGFSLKGGFCLIEGTCAKAGTSPAGMACQVCDTKTPAAWSNKATGATCDDGSVCTTGDKCDASGVCKGSTPVANCCVTDDDCGALAGTAGPCDKAACNLTSGKCALAPIPNCCTDGKCCDIPNKTLLDKNTPCNTFVKNTEYQCSGQEVQKRSVFYGCTGDSPTKCSSDVPGYGDWKTTVTCGAESKCVFDGVTASCKAK